jgi:hypothetical protein
MTKTQTNKMSQAQINFLKFNADYFNRGFPKSRRITPKMRTIGDREQQIYERFYYGLVLVVFWLKKPINLMKDNLSTLAI